MEPSLPSPPRTIIVIDNSPSEVSSFLCSVLDAHALPYAVQVIDPGAPPLLRLNDTRPLRAGQGLWRRLTALGLAVIPLRRLRHFLQQHPAVRSSTPRRLRWPHGSAWGLGLGLVLSGVAGMPWLWQTGQLPRGPISPPPPSDYIAAALLGAAAPVAPPAAAVRPPTQSQTPAAHARLTSPALGDTSPGGLLPRLRASVAQNAASLRPPASAQTRASRAARVRPPRKRYARLRPAPRGDLITVRNDAASFTRPRAVEHAQVVGAHRPAEWSGALPASKPSWWQGALDPALEGEHPWNRHLVNDTGA
jgi:hypothetical protein